MNKDKRRLKRKKIQRQKKDQGLVDQLLAKTGLTISQAVEQGYIKEVRR